MGSTGDSPVVSGDSPETLRSVFSPTFNHTHSKQVRLIPDFRFLQSDYCVRVLNSLKWCLRAGCHGSLEIVYDPIELLSADEWLETPR